MNKTIPQTGVIKELLAEAGLGAVKGNTKSYILTCPRCKKRDKLYLRKTDGRFVCWVCKETDNFQGSPEYLFSELLGRSIGELRKAIWGLDGPTASISMDLNLTDWFGESDVIPSAVQRLPMVEPHPDFRELTSVWSVPGVEYLAGRGVPVDVAMRYGIQYWPAEKRVVFPVSSQGRLLGWQSRYIGPTEFEDEEGNLVKIPKALTYVNLKKDRTLMFADRITGSHAVLTEGPMDAIKADLCGGNVCSMGKAVSPWQLNLLRNSGITKLYLGLDPDAAVEVERIVRDMSHEIELYDMRPPANTDLGAMTFEEVFDLFKGAQRTDTSKIFLYLKNHYDRN